ncbi:MAG: alkaline phosphatase PhoX [Planctomycetota bacterium]
MSRSRRRFLSDNFTILTSVAISTSFGALSSRLAMGSPASRPELVPVNDANTGLPLLRLPEGFSYRSFGWTGDAMDDGVLTPSLHDGMGVVKADGDKLTLIRNHEVSTDGEAIHNELGATYDPQAQGGCSRMHFDSVTGQWLGSHMALSGTSRNCAGGVTPWGTWLTAEETVLGPDDIDRYKDDAVRKFEKTHGWVFEVPADGTPTAEPITGMGRFVHEAVCVDSESGIVYLTEDRDPSGFYRYVPVEPGNLAAGGELQIAEVVGQEDLRGGFENGSKFGINWHTIPDPSVASTPGTETPDELGVFMQGKQLGGSMFARLEGCWFGNNLVYFDATSGGAKQAGQIWQYDPASQELMLLFESPDKPVLNMPDNLCVTPRGGIVLCEDNDYGANEYPQRMFGLSPEGELRLFAENNCILNGEKNGFTGDFRTKEWAGATFSPDGKWLFVNIQTPGITFAITGPWDSTLL